MKQIIMIASENDALINAKVGGLADVLKNLPYALADYGFRITVITPSYGFLHKDNPSEFLSRVTFCFSGKLMVGEFWQVTPKSQHKNVTHLVFEHPKIVDKSIYSDDPPGHAFAKDSTKFALYCSAVGQYLKNWSQSTIIHLHDWHTPYLIMLRDLHPDFKHLKHHKIIFTIHNLAYQGTRPIQGKHASVEQWFPELFHDTAWIEKWKDPRYKEPQFTPLLAGIQYADKVNTVSPTYAEEILKPSNHKNGFFGGEGLEEFLQKVEQKNSLFGILNGCEYPVYSKTQKMQWDPMCDMMIDELHKESKNNPDSLYAQVIKRIKKIRYTPPEILLTSVTRVSEQKLKLLFEKGSNGETAIEDILTKLNTTNGNFILLGTGTPDYEEKLMKAFHKHERFIYLKLHSKLIAQALYANGTIFMMPSSFEPCGISQMIAMMNGQPCIVNAVGGLKDTVIDGVNGFQFSGNSIHEKIDNCVIVTQKAIDLYFDDKIKWGKIKSQASKARFEWKESARRYIEKLYTS